MSEYVHYIFLRIHHADQGGNQVNEHASKGYRVISTAAGGQNGEVLWITLARAEKREALPVQPVGGVPT